MERLIKGVSGVKFKGFKTIQEAEDFLNGRSPQKTPLLKYNLNIFVDGSYNKDLDMVGSGLVILDKNENIIFEKAFASDWHKESWNVSGEILSVLTVLGWLKERNSEETVGIFYDYLGIEK